MWPYWLMFLLPAWVAYEGRDHARYLANGRPSLALQGGWLVLLLALTLLIGFRFRVGGDWNNYYRVYESLVGKTFDEIIQLGDPGYQLLNWWAMQVGWGVIGVNTIAAAIFSVGLLIFCRSQPKPWLALAISIPYLVIVVAMGYTRQGVAIGLGMMALVALERRAITWFAIWVILAVTFHKSAILLFPIAALAATRKKIWAAIWVGVIASLTFRLLVEQDANALYTNYVEAQYQSEGAFIRLAMNALPAFILIKWRKRFSLTPEAWGLWRVMAIIALGLLVMYFVSPASTALDRIGLYLIPLQLMVFSHLPNAMGSPILNNTKWTTRILFYYAAVMFVWLNFASNAGFWVPYRSFIFA